MPETCGRAALACLPKVVLPREAMQGKRLQTGSGKSKGEVQYVRHSGGYSVGVPPLPIPNREVKPNRADGTAYSGRVGRRHLFPVPSSGKCLKEGFFCCIARSPEALRPVMRLRTVAISFQARKCGSLRKNTYFCHSICQVRGFAAASPLRLREPIRFLWTSILFQLENTGPPTSIV